MYLLLKMVGFPMLCWFTRGYHITPFNIKYKLVKFPSSLYLPNPNHLSFSTKNASSLGHPGSPNGSIYYRVIMYYIYIGCQNPTPQPRIQPQHNQPSNRDHWITLYFLEERSNNANLHGHFEEFCLKKKWTVYVDKIYGGKMPQSIHQLG